MVHILEPRTITLVTLQYVELFLKIVLNCFLLKQYFYLSTTAKKIFLLDWVIFIITQDPRRTNAIT